MDKHRQLTEYIRQHPEAVNKVVEFDTGVTRFYQFHFTAANTALSAIDIADTDTFSRWVDQQLYAHDCRYGIGGYMEHRTIYYRSELFDADDEPRRLHLGIDIWAKSGTHVYASLAGTIHSFADNNHFGDYGPTIILQHDLDGLMLYSLYGHLSRKSLAGLAVGQKIASGEKIAELGEAFENGNWPPHLHFQLMFDMGSFHGDYPGVGKPSEKETLMANIPDPNIILQLAASTIVR